MALSDSDMQRITDLLRAELGPMKIQHEKNSKLLEKVDKIVTGGDAPEDGLSMKVDRLNQAEGRRKTLSGVTIATLIGAVIMTVFNFFTGS